eukprot:5962002-Prymnesium_polylepis.1
MGGAAARRASGNESGQPTHGGGRRHVQRGRSNANPPAGGSSVAMQSAVPVRCRLGDRVPPATRAAMQS